MTGDTHDVPDPEWDVTVSLRLSAEDAEDAVRQMVGTLFDRADKMAYRVGLAGSSATVQIDAEELALT